MSEAQKVAQEARGNLSKLSNETNKKFKSINKKYKEGLKKAEEEKMERGHFVVEVFRQPWQGFLQGWKEGRESGRNAKTEKPAKTKQKEAKKVMDMDWLMDTLDVSPVKITPVDKPIGEVGSTDYPDQLNGNSVRHSGITHWELPDGRQCFSFKVTIDGEKDIVTLFQRHRDEKSLSAAQAHNYKGSHGAAADALLSAIIAGEADTVRSFLNGELVEVNERKMQIV